MVTKTITIMKDAYDLLAKEKLSEESFSDTIRRLAGKKKDIKDFFGVWSQETADDIKRIIEERRKLNQERQMRRWTK